jgi:oligosaccharide repeat unit polymerase
MKHDYRDFLNEGTSQQVVSQPLTARLGYLGTAADQFNSNEFQTGLRAFTSRESYIDVLSAVIDHVPDVVPFQNGELVGTAILNMVEPRIFFPDKPETPDDSIVATQYTGLRFDLAYNTSISIGYLGEMYIDFGKFGAAIGAFLIGLISGRMYAFLRGYTGIPLLFTYAILTMCMLLFIFFEIDLVRFMGAALTVFFACVILQRFIAPQVLIALIARVPRAKA